MWWATVETRNFRFDAFVEAQTAADARAEAGRLLQAAWAKHKAQTGASMRFSEFVEELQLRPVAGGVVLRDGERFLAR